MSEPRRLVALYFVTAAWLSSFILLANHGARLLPISVARLLTLQTFLIVVHLVTVGFGVVLSLLLFAEPRKELGLGRPKLGALGLTLLLAPVAYVASSYLAIHIALPTLLDELARGGRALVQQQSGEFGRSITRAPLLPTLIWASLVSPISEELLFRGVAWSAVQRAVERFAPLGPSSPPSSLDLAVPISDGIVARGFGSIGRWFVTGGIATLVTTALFTALHADMPGGLGIVRVVSAAGLGLACALARQHSGGIAAPIALHIVYNTLSLAATRRWVVTDGFPMLRGVPTLLTALAAACLVVALVALGLRAAFRKRAR